MHADCIENICSCYNCLDRWVEAGRGNQACFLWEGNGAPVFRARTMSYREVLDETCRLVRSCGCATLRFD